MTTKKPKYEQWVGKNVALLVDEQEVVGKVAKIEQGLLYLDATNGKKLVVQIAKISDIKAQE